MSDVEARRRDRIQTLSVVCHGHEHAERHTLPADYAAVLLEWFTGDDWSGGPRCLVDILRFIREENTTSPPLARR